MDATAPRFTVLLPTHDRADVLGFAIASVLAQTEPDFELLVVADGCTDTTASVVASFTDPRIRFFDLPKAPGFGYANRNVALREARGRLVAYAAHDDLLLPDHLAMMGDLLERTGCTWGYSRPLWISPDGVIVPFGTNLRLADELQSFRAERNTLPSSCIVTMRAAQDRAGLWPEDVLQAGDWVLWRRILDQNGGQVAYSRQPTTLHFSANWRQSRFSNMREMRTLLAIADHVAWWPDILRQPPADELEQATVWRAIRDGGDAWVAELRAAVDTVMDRIAWNAVRELLPRLDVEFGRLRQIVGRISAAAQPGPLRGGIDRIIAPSQVLGWALDADHPDLPVLLEVLLDDRIIGTALASEYRQDLADAGVGDGHCAFAFRAPEMLSADMLRVRRAADGKELPMSAECRRLLGQGSTQDGR